MHIVIKIHGWLGDNLLAQPAAERLRLQYPYVSQISWFTGWPQVAPLLELNPFIDKVYTSENPSPDPEIPEELASAADLIVETKPYRADYPLTIEHQVNLKVAKPVLGYEVYLDDDLVDSLVDKQKSTYKVGICRTWKNWERQQIPDDLWTEIYNNVAAKYEVEAFGLQPAESQFIGATSTYKPTYFEMAHRMTTCDLIIGSEGGLTNLAAGIGVSTLITSDFTESLAGSSGSHYRCRDPFKFISPMAYFPNGLHRRVPECFERDYPTNITREVDQFFLNHGEIIRHTL